MLTLTIARQDLEAIAGGSPQVPKTLGRVNHEELGSRSPLDLVRQPPCDQTREDGRSPLVELGLKENRLPEWAVDKFSLEIDTRYSEPVVTFEGTPARIHTAAAELALTLTDTIDHMVLKEVPLAVRAHCRWRGPKTPVTPNCLRR